MRVKRAGSSTLLRLRARAQIIIGGFVLANGAADQGAAILVQDENLSLVNCTLTGNSSTANGGAINVTGSSVIQLTRCQLNGNSATGNGGGLSVAGGDITISDSTFANNQAKGSDGGGAIYHGGSGSISIRNSTLSGNSATNIGGAIFVGPGLTATVVLQNSTVTNNSANKGGGLGRSAGTSALSLESTIMSGNSANTTGPDVSTPGSVNAVTSLLGTLSGISTYSGDAVSNFYLGKAPLCNRWPTTVGRLLLTRYNPIAPPLETDQTLRRRYPRINAANCEL